MKCNSVDISILADAKEGTYSGVCARCGWRGKERTLHDLHVAFREHRKVEQPLLKRGR